MVPLRPHWPRVCVPPADGPAEEEELGLVQARSVVLPRTSPDALQLVPDLVGREQVEVLWEKDPL